MLNSRFSDKIAQASKRFLQHRCTVVGYVNSGVLDEGGHPIYNEVSTSDVVCLFLWQDRSVTDERGTVVERVPTIYFLNSQTLRTGDIVRNIYARNGTNLLSSGRVNTIDGTAEGGNISLKVAELEGAVM